MEHYMVPVCIVGTLYNTLNHDFNFLMYNTVHLVVYCLDLLLPLVTIKCFDRRHKITLAAWTMCQQWGLIDGRLIGERIHLVLLD